MAEYGLVAPQYLPRLRRVIPEWLEDAENGLSERFRRLLYGLWGDLQALERRVAELDAEIEAIAYSDPVAQRLQQLRGVGRRPLEAAEKAGQTRGYEGLLVKAQSSAEHFFIARGYRRLPIEDPARDYAYRYWKALTP